MYVSEGEKDAKIFHHPEGFWSKRAFKTLHYPAYYIVHLVFTVSLMLLAIIESPISQKGRHPTHQENPILSVRSHNMYSLARSLGQHAFPFTLQCWYEVSLELLSLSLSLSLSHSLDRSIDRAPPHIHPSCSPCLLSSHHFFFSSLPSSIMYMCTHN